MMNSLTVNLWAGFGPEKKKLRRKQQAVHTIWRAQ